MPKSIAADKGRKPAQKIYRDYLPSNVSESGDFFKDVEAGSRLAFNFLHSMRGVGPELGWLVKDLIENGRFGPVEVGFFNVIGRSLKHPYVALPTTLTREEFNLVMAAEASGEKPGELAVGPDIEGKALVHCV
jgi:hypothetical protein